MHNQLHNVSCYNNIHFCRSVEAGDEQSSGLGPLFSEQVSHIAAPTLEFFVRWYWLLAEEEQCCRSKQNPLPWLASSHQRYVHTFALTYVQVSFLAHTSLGEG